MRPGRVLLQRLLIISTIWKILMNRLKVLKKSGWIILRMRIFFTTKKIKIFKFNYSCEKPNNILLLFFHFIWFDISFYKYILIFFLVFMYPCLSFSDDKNSSKTYEIDEIKIEFAGKSTYDENEIKVFLHLSIAMILIMALIFRMLSGLKNFILTTDFSILL